MSIGKRSVPYNWHFLQGLDIWRHINSKHHRNGFISLPNPKTDRRDPLNRTTDWFGSSPMTSTALTHDWQK